MPSAFAETLRQARTLVRDAPKAEPGEAAVATRIIRYLDDAIRVLEGAEVEADLISIVCHDLRDPLASIVMGTGFLRKTMPTDETAARRVVEAISRSADRLGQVVADFHDVAKLEAGRLVIEAKSWDLSAVLNAEAAKLEALAAERSIRLEFEGLARPLVAMVDRGRVVQVVSKLVGNALKFTPASGRVLVRMDQEGDFVRIAVTDTGRGIPPARLESIFDRAANARRSPRDGPGLGLPIVRGIVELHGGRVSVESRLNEGSRFIVTIPRGR
jgi:signal transduction histidine kinase